MSNPRQGQQVRILIIARDQAKFKKAAQFLTRRGWPSDVVPGIKQAVEYVVKYRPMFVMVSFSIPNGNITKLPNLLMQTFNANCIAFGEGTDPKTTKRLNSCRLKHIFYGALSGPSIHMRIKKILIEIEKEKARERQQPQQQEEGGAGPLNAAAAPPVPPPDPNQNPGAAPQVGAPPPEPGNFQQPQNYNPHAAQAQGNFQQPGYNQHAQQPGAAGFQQPPPPGYNPNEFPGNQPPNRQQHYEEDGDNYWNDEKPKFGTDAAADYDYNNGEAPPHHPEAAGMPGGEMFDDQSEGMGYGEDGAMFDDAFAAAPEGGALPPDAAAQAAGGMPPGMDPMQQPGAYNPQESGFPQGEMGGPAPFNPQDGMNMEGGAMPPDAAAQAAGGMPPGMDPTQQPGAYNPQESGFPQGEMGGPASYNPQDANNMEGGTLPPDAAAQAMGEMPPGMDPTQQPGAYNPQESGFPTGEVGGPASYNPQDANNMEGGALPPDAAAQAMGEMPPGMDPTQQPGAYNPQESGFPTGEMGGPTSYNPQAANNMEGGAMPPDAAAQAMGEMPPGMDPTQQPGNFDPFNADANPAMPGAMPMDPEHPAQPGAPAPEYQQDPMAAGPDQCDQAPHPTNPNEMPMADELDPSLNPAMDNGGFGEEAAAAGLEADPAAQAPVASPGEMPPDAVNPTGAAPVDPSAANPTGAAPVDPSAANPTGAAPMSPEAANPTGAPPTSPGVESPTGAAPGTAPQANPTGGGEGQPNIAPNGVPLTPEGAPSPSVPPLGLAENPNTPPPQIGGHRVNNPHLQEIAKAFDKGFTEACNDTASNATRINDGASSVGVVSVKSQEATGYLIFAKPKEASLSDEFWEGVKKSIQDSLKNDMLEFELAENFTMEINRVAFVSWAAASADFISVKQHESYEVAMAFFSVANVPSMREADDVESMSVVNVSSIVPDVEADFRGYINFKKNDKLILYIKKGRSISTVQKSRLINKSVDEMYIPAEEAEIFKSQMAQETINQRIRHYLNYLEQMRAAQNVA